MVLRLLSCCCLQLDGVTNISYRLKQFFQEKPNSVILEDKCISKFHSTKISIFLSQTADLYSNLGTAVATETEEMDQIFVEN